MTPELEYALMVDHEDGNAVEYVPATSPEHAARMASKLYAGRPSWTVQRPIQPWYFAGFGEPVLAR